MTVHDMRPDDSGRPARRGPSEQHDVRIAFGTLVIWLSRLTSMLLGLLLIPLLLRQMTQEDVGIWFMLAQATIFVGLLDFGFSLTLTRRIAFAAGRRDRADTATTDATNLEIADLFATAKKVYHVLAVVALFIAAVAGFFLFRQIETSAEGSRQLWIAWALICISQAAALWAAPWACLLQGTGYVGWDGVVGVVVQIATVLAQIAAVTLGGGLVGLALTSAVCSALPRFCYIRFMKRREPQLVAIRGRWDRAAFRSSLPLALKAWGTGLGGALILRTDHYFIAYFLGPGAIPDYQAAFQITFNLLTLSLAAAAASQVSVSQLWQCGDTAALHRVVERNVRFALIVMVSGVSILLVAGDEVISSWIGHSHFVGYPVLYVFCLTLLLEVQHASLASACRSTDEEPFLWWAIASGVLNLFLSWWFVQAYGLLGVALATFLAQASTNNWYVVHRTLRRLALPKRRYLKRVLLPVGATFALDLICCAAVKLGVGRATDNAVVIGVAVIAASAAVFVVALRLFVLDGRGRLFAGARQAAR
jgi:O-antigen/teichoic acid export membrane protein